MSDAPPPARRKRPRRSHDLRVIGWRARVDFPAWELEGVKAKVDTGARTSSLHATHVRPFERDGEAWVRFRVHSGPRGARRHTAAEAPLVDRRKIRSSNGQVEERLVIRTTVRAVGLEWEAELSLARRGSMAFPMLLGRACLKRRFLVDAGRSYVKPPSPPGATG